MSPDQIFALVLALIGGEPDASNFPVVAEGGADPRYPVAIAACPRPVAPAEIEGETIVCGTVSVPLNHAEPEGLHVDLLFAVYRSRSLAPAPDPVVHLHGGPGSGIMQNVSATTQFFEHLRARRDIVAFDQRGVDTSGGIDRCFDTIADNVEPIVKTLADDGAPELVTELVASCLAELQENGIDIRYINTEQNAMDVRALMTALGYDEYNIYGISYGTKLGLEVMRTAPEGLRSVVVDSVAPPSVNLYDTLLLPHWEAVENTYQQCEAQPACAEAYPNIADRYWALVQQTFETPIETADGPFSGLELFLLVSERNNWTSPLRGLSPWLPLMVSELEQGNTATLDAVRRGQIPPPRTVESAMAGAGGLSLADQVLARTALEAAEQIGGLEQMAQRAIAALESDIAKASEATILAEEFDIELQGALEALPERNQRVDFARDYLALQAETPAKARLIGLVSTHFDDGTRDRLISLIQLMTDDDVVDTFDRIGRDNAAIEQVLMATFEQYLFACQEDMDFNSNEGVAAVHDAIDAAPALEGGVAAQQDRMYANCALFEQHPREGFHDPVASDIPALVLGGELDTQTAGSWAPLAAETLSNGRAIVFPETGHGALVFSQCARDIGVAFIENPGAPINTSCVSDLRPSFVLPDGTWSHPE